MVFLRLKMAIPSKKLVGKNQVLVDRVYSDDYIKALNRYVSVDEVFGEHKKEISKGEFCPVARFTMGALSKLEHENHLVALVMRAARAGEWRAVERGPEHRSGLDEVTEKSFGYVIRYQDKTFLLPSARYLAYCKEQL